LRERPADVAPLLEYFLAQAAERFGRPTLRPSRRELQVLERYRWPGNARELAGFAERTILLGRWDLAALRGEDRPAPAAGEPAIPAAEWRRRERANLEAALAQGRGRIYGKDGAAALLGVPPTTLASRLRALGVKRV
jgi:DNA-binding NtrC family response regulator